MVRKVVKTRINEREYDLLCVLEYVLKIFQEAKIAIPQYAY